MCGEILYFIDASTHRHPKRRLSGQFILLGHVHLLEIHMLLYDFRVDPL